MVWYRLMQYEMAQTNYKCHLMWKDTFKEMKPLRMMTF